ncbi:amine oxidase catalytic domain-containing protein [Podospora appendiculata]|uniref:Amine oxidase n=1 Tax=Podospora appendiculata TaxID=314037 RepID=A0AAE0XCG4_9PEZI|nr:amine oxidase catalytic domain-containing protein [Podospora appendiculata]
MGLFGSISPKSLLASALLLTSLSQDVFARPNPEPKVPWVRKGSGRKKMAHNLKRAVEGERRATEPETCAQTVTTTITAPKANVWGELIDVETAGVVSWLFAQKDLNLTLTENATNWDNTIQLIEAMWPNKTDAISYIDGNATTPTKYAHVVLNFRATENPYYADILVGPLPIDNKTATWEPLTYPYTKQSGGHVRNLDADSDLLYSEWIYPISASIADITLDLWNGTALGLDNDTLDIWGIDPLWQDDGRIIRWDSFWNLPTSEFDSETLLPLGLYFGSDITGRDPSQWKFEGWFYNNIFYETTEDFRSAYFSSCFKKLGANVDGAWAHSDRQGPVSPNDAAYPPESVAPAGSRFALDRKEKYVEWMDFTFYIAFNRDTGMALYDIRYKGERILYELGLQEALAHYAGNDPMQSGTSYLDTFYGFGPYAFELVPGYDCPAYATYLNSSFYVAETTHTHINSVCLFEFTGDFAMQRHTTSAYTSATKNTYFVVRSVSTVGNYDYTFSYSFFVDGSIAVEVRASGYIQSAYFANNEDYGYKINEFLSGSMHDHVLNFKADFDILGTSNSIQLMTNVPTVKTYPWSKGKARSTMTLERSFLETEDEGRFNWAPNSATQVLVVNEDEKNKNGEIRGYRVLPYTGAAHLTVLNSTNLGNAARWAEYDIQVTQHKDSEPRAAHAFNSQDVADPPINFADFFNGESVRKEDVVVWLNLGMHHVPHTGDLPNTVMTTAHAGVQFMPSNYFDIDQSRSTVNMVRINYKDGKATAVETFGQDEAKAAGACTPVFTPVELNLWGYTGDIVVRKFPFDPNNPYYGTESIV